MKKIVTIITDFFLMLFIFGFSISAFSQVSMKQKRERKKMIRECSKSKNPYIRLDQLKELSVDEFLNYSDSIYQIIRVKGTDTITNSQNQNVVVDGAILVITPQYHDMRNFESRKASIRDYRVNEIKTFFGREAPLILMGDREITREEYYELSEDTVAFVNFYMTDFVKKYYAPKGSRGIVYVCPRNTRSHIKYIPTLDLPANGRNYINDFYREIFPCFMGHNKISHVFYTNEKVKEYKEKIGNDIKAIVCISCVVRPNGTIEPILVEDIETRQELTDVQLGTIISISEEIIRTMPRWEMPGGGVIYNKGNRVYLEDIREHSISIPICFGAN